MVPGPTRPITPNGISIESAVFPEVTVVTIGQTDAQTDRQTTRPTKRTRNSTFVA